MVVAEDFEDQAMSYRSSADIQSSVNMRILNNLTSISWLLFNYLVYLERTQ